MGDITDTETEEFIFNLIENRGVCFESEIIAILTNMEISNYLSKKFIDELPIKYKQIKIYNRNVIIFDDRKIVRIKNKLLHLAKLNYPNKIIDTNKIYNIIAQEEKISNKLIKVLCSDIFNSELKLIECMNNTGYSFCIPIPINENNEFNNLLIKIQNYVYKNEIVTQLEIINEFNISKRYSRILIERLVFKSLIGFNVQRNFDDIQTNKIYSPKVFILPISEILDSRRTRDESIVMEYIKSILQEINLEYLYPTTFGIVKKSLEINLTYGSKKSEEIIPSAIIISSILHDTPITYEMLNDYLGEDNNYELCSETKCREKIREIKQKLHIPTKINCISFVKQILNFMNISLQEKEILINIINQLLKNEKLKHTISGNNPWAASSALIYITANNCKKKNKKFFYTDYRQITIAYAAKIAEVSLRNLRDAIAKENLQFIYDTIINHL